MVFQLTVTITVSYLSYCFGHVNVYTCLSEMVLDQLSSDAAFNLFNSKLTLLHIL